MTVDGNQLSHTLNALESGLRVYDIATLELATCQSDEVAAAVLSDPDLTAFDQIPVRRDGLIVGVLERPLGEEHVTDHTAVSSVMRTLDESLLVTAELPLPQFVKRVMRAQYHLVVVGAEIGGLVTSSDMLKLPVRLLAFAYVAHLESQLSVVIRRLSDGDAWLERLDAARRRSVNRRARRLSRDRMDPDLLELTLFSDKTQVIASLLALSGAETDQLKAIEEMRNQVAHGMAYAVDDHQLRHFIHTLEQSEQWIDRLTAVATGDATPA